MVLSGVVAGLDLEPHRAVVRFAGRLTLRTSADVRQVLIKLLATHGEVLVDLSSFRLAWHPAATVFATALSTSGGFWSEAVAAGSTWWLHCPLSGM